MKMSQLFTKTTKNVPADEASKNAQLLIQAGFVHKEMAGVYSFLPLGLKVLNKIADIIRDEMNAMGGQELLMPALQVKERYEATGRWDDKVVDNWFKTKLVNGAELGLGFSHEENLTPIIKNFVNSYRDLPIIPYQIQSKFRNELRSKSGLMRGREFLMKDMYSFAISQDQHDEIYEKSKQAYKSVYDRVGIGDRTFITFASGGIFSKYSHEFQTLSEAGEDTIFQTEDGTFYNREVAPAKIGKANLTEDFMEYEEVEGKGVIGVQALLKQLNLPIEKSTKTFFFTTDAGQTIVAALRSDYDVNDFKLCEAIGCKSVTLADEAVVKDLTGAEIGYAGLVNLPENIAVYYDDSLDGLCNFETGSNKTGYHSINTNFGRDAKQPEQFHDFKLAKAGDLDPKTNEPMRAEKAIEVGNIFSLATKFSEPFDLRIDNEQGESVTLIMGCYGIGVSRLMGTIAELLSDEKGLVWPEAIAPAKVYLARLSDKDQVVKTADDLYNQLGELGIEVLYDDRDVRPGQKFADADLMGIPFRVVVSEKTVEANTFELKARTSTEVQQLSLDDVIKTLGVPN